MLRRYGIWGILRLLRSLSYTKLFFPRARIIRLPFDIRNKYLIDLGKNLTTGCGCRIEALEDVSSEKGTLIKFGNNVQINDYVHIAGGESVYIGDNVLIASKVFITDINHGTYKGKIPDSPFSYPNDRSLSTNPVSIENNVWLGENVCIMPGVTVGFGSIVGAGAIVTKSIPPHCIAVGNPARVVKMYIAETEQWESIGDEKGWYGK